MEDFKKVIKNNPKNERAIHNLSVCKFRVKNHHEALELSNKAISICKDEENLKPIFLKHRGEILLDIEELEAAKSDLDQAIELNQSESEFFYIRSKINLKLGDIEKSSMDINKAIELDKSKEIYQKFKNQLS